MFHYIVGTIVHEHGFVYIRNEQRGVQVEYAGKQKEGSFWLFPSFDDHQKTIYYFARDSNAEKSLFMKMLKMGGVGPKTAFTISQLDQQKLQQAVDALDVAFFQAVPGIGPKIAKRLVVDLRAAMKQDELLKISGDDKSLKDIMKYCKGLGYDMDRVKKQLNVYQGPIRKDTVTDVIAWLLAHL